MYKLTDDKIEQFLIESSMMQSHLIDDGPPTFYKSFGEYKTNAKSWMDELYKELGWKVIDYMIRKNAQDPGYDYELRYRALGAVSYLDSGVKSGNTDAIEKYKKRMEKNLETLGWTITAWLGVEAAHDSLIGTVLSAGVGKKVNQDDLEETFSKEWWSKELLKEAGEKYWTDMSVDAQQDYISKHKTSKKVEPDNPSGKKERDHEPEEGPTLENHEKYYVHENENSKIIGTLHKPQKPNYDDYDDKKAYLKDLEIYKKENAKFMDFYEETVKKEVEAFLNKHGAENVVFMAEGGDEGDNYKEGSEQHMVADHVKGQGGTVDTFDGPEMSQWVNQEGSKDENGDDLFDRLSKNSKPPKTRSQSAAGIYAMMVGQGDDGGDAMEYMGESSGVDQKEAEQYLKDNGYVGSIPPKNKSEKRHLYLLAFPGDASEKEKKKYNIKEPNGVSEVTDSHNKARQNNMIKKREHYENSDPPKKVLVVPGASHAFEMRDEFLEKKKEERFSIEAAKKGFKAQSINENLKLILEIDERMTLEEGVKFNNFLKDWAKRGKQPLDKVRKSMMNKNTFSVAKLNDFSVDKVFEMAKKGFRGYQKIINYVPDKIAQQLAKTKFGQKKEKALVKLDDYLKNHPKLKRVMGIAAAAAVTYAWTKMTFIGDPEYDLDLSAAASAAALGDVSFANLFSGEMGTKFLVLTVVGASTGLTAPYVKAFGRVGTMAAGLSFGAYRAYKARKQKKADAEKKTKTTAPDTVKNPNPKGRKKTVGRKSAIQWVAKTKGNKAAIKYAKSLQEGILLEGGAAGHMNHPFDDSGLTFGDFKQIIKLGLSGKLNREDDVTEKLDGQNLLVSWKDDKLIAARNKSQLKGFGANALDVNGVASKFAGRGNIKNAFVFAMKDLQKAIKGLSKGQKDKVFGEGKRWMNLEVMYPASANVVNYDGAYLVFHNATEYNEAGMAIKTDTSLARILEGMIRQVNQHIQKKFTISKPQFLKVSKSQDFAKRQKYFLSKLQKLQNIYNLKDKDTLGKYHETYWMEYIHNASKQMKYNIPRNVLNSLTKRWAFLDKSFRLNNKVIKHDKFLDWAKSTDKKDMKRLQKDNIKPFEMLFFELGAEILKNVSGFLAANPKQTVSKMKREVDVAIKQLRAAKDVSKLDTLKRQLEKFEAIGGSQAIVPSEGIVFKYKNKMYKFTGAFAPINQILGLLTFG